MNLLLFDSLTPGRRKVLVWIASVWVFYTAFGFFILPPVVRAVAVKQLSKQLGRSITIEKIELNPYTLSATLRGVLVKDKDGEPLLSWNEAYFNLQLASLFHGAWMFKEVRLSQAFVRVQMNKDYTLTFSDLANTLWTPVTPRRSGAGKGRGLRIDQLRFIDARAAFIDLTPRVPFRRTIGPFAMTLTHFRTDSDYKNLYALSGITDAGEQIAGQGFFYLDPIRSEGQFLLKGICLTNYAPLYQDAVRFEIRDGMATLRSNYRYERSARNHLLSLSNTTFAAQSLKVLQKDTGQTIFELSQGLVSGASLDVMARRADAETVTITGGRLVLVRNKNRSVNLIELAKPAETGPKMPGEILLLLRGMTNVVAMLLNATNLSTGAIRELDLTNCTLHLKDLANLQPVGLDLQDIAVSARNISNRPGTNMTAEVRMRWDTNGIVRARIRAALSPAEAEVKLALDELNLRPLAAYLEPNLDVRVLGAKLGLAGTLQWRGIKEELPEVRFHGDAWLDEFASAEGIETESLLKWKTLRLSGMEANLNPPVVSMTEARLEEVSALLIIETNHTVNLLSALRRGGTNAPTPHPTTRVPPWAIGPKVSIGSLVFSNANVHFVDRSVRPNVNVTLGQLNGTVSGLSSDGPEPAAVDLRGALDKTARVRINGSVNPWNQEQPTEMKIAIQEMDLRPEDPYSRKYLGYQLQQGDLSLDTRFHLAEQKLTSQNRITLDHLVLGEKVESPEATKLPIRLAIAILKDRTGRIELEVPVDGSLEDPDFHLGDVISSAMGNVFNRIATSPFLALSSLFGGKGEAYSFLEFEPGSTKLLPPSLQKLGALVNVLSERPELRLAIEGGADPETDGEALRRGKRRNQGRLQEREGKVTPVDMTTAELHTLAFERARNVQAYLLQIGKVQEERMSITNTGWGTPGRGRHVYFQLQ
jgi:hypothetical protein